MAGNVSSPAMGHSMWFRAADCPLLAARRGASPTLGPESHGQASDRNRGKTCCACD